jgi:hypothetical protein
MTANKHNHPKPLQTRMFSFEYLNDVVLDAFSAVQGCNATAKMSLGR